ncbi:MAG: hypothetical protein PVG54_19975 [Anaerolineae bacterium]|jgi:hypothetical protein
MAKIHVMARCGMMFLALLLIACEGYTQVGSSTSSYQDANGGRIETTIQKANGTITEDIEVDSTGSLVLETDVTLSVGEGTYKIELLGEDGEVTLVLEARGGQAISGHGQMVTDAFGEASYRVTATEAEDVQYTLDYTFR